MMTRDCEQLVDLLPGRALGALEAGEDEVVERHVDRCPDCASELAEYLRVSAQLAALAPAHDPPPELGARILEAARADLEDAPPRLAALPRRPMRWSLAGWWRQVSPQVAAFSLGAAALAIGWGYSTQQSLDRMQSQLNDTQQQIDRIRDSYQTVALVLASGDMRVQNLGPGEVTATAWGKVWTDPSTGKGMLMAKGLPAVDAGHCFQVWLTRDDQRISAGFLYPVGNGVYYTVLQAPRPVTDYQRVGVTIEPTGGSPGPTTPRVVGGTI
ncbi:MAG: anti-sigma factor [Chloroflexi bacterium]|nr:anti-sigma factor [Chloroflexota bacterium]